MNRRLEAICTLVAIVAAMTAVWTGIRWGTFAAGGSDSSCYLTQAEAFARGDVLLKESLGEDPSWPGTPGAFVPTGYVPGSTPGAAVPICPAGYPALMSLARLVGGRTLMFWVTPLLGGLAVWFAFLLARSIADPLAGVAAAVITAASPMFLYQLVQPMNDVPATAAWAGVLVAATRTRWQVNRRALTSGLLAGAALTIRPNLLALAVVAGLGAVLLPQQLTWRQRTAALVVFGFAALPGVAAILAVQNAMHGSPFRSGYGDLDYLFSISYVMPNARQYGAWLMQTHTPLVLGGLVSPMLLRGSARRTALFFVIFVAATVASYLPYTVFDAWWYLRFLLPAILPLVVLMAAGAAVSLRWPPLARAATIAAGVAILAAFYVITAQRRQVFELKALESRFITAGEFVNTLPKNAVIVTGYQSGSVRFYSGRSTIAWGDIYEDRLSEALEFLRRHGRKPYLLFETWEEPAFKERFARHDRLGALEWPPRADIDRVVRIYDPDDHERYLGGEYVPTELIRTRR